MGSRHKKMATSASTALRMRDQFAFDPAVREDEIVGLLSALRAALPPKRSYAIGVISALPGEGVTSIAQSLAAVAARNPRTKVMLCKVPGEPTSVQSAPLIMMETAAATPGDRLVVGNFGGFPLAQAVSSAPGAEQAIVRSMSASFDLVIIDLPPVSESTLGPSLAKGLDGVVLVVEAERTRAHSVKAARKSIEMYGGTVLGVVLNKRRYHIPEAIYRRL